MVWEAVAATRFYWPEIPTLGMVTFVNADKVRAKRDPGRCFRRVGFLPEGETVGGLIALRLPPERMPDPAPALLMQLGLDGLKALQ